MQVIFYHCNDAHKSFLSKDDLRSPHNETDDLLPRSAAEIHDLHEYRDLISVIQKSLVYIVLIFGAM